MKKMKQSHEAAVLENNKKIDAERDNLNLHLKAEEERKELPRKTEGLRNSREEIWKMNQERQNFILIKNFSAISLEGLFLCVEQVKIYC